MEEMGRCGYNPPIVCSRMQSIFALFSPLDRADAHGLHKECPCLKNFSPLIWTLSLS